MRQRKTKKKRISIREEYKKCFDYLRESKDFIYFVILIFFIFSVIGFIFPAPDYILERLMDLILELVSQTDGLSTLGLIQFIFINNLESSFFGLLFGVVAGIFPLVSSIFNGFLLGFVAHLSVNAEGFLSLWRIFPHGIFELPAIFISFGLGLKLGTFIFQDKKIESLVNFFFNSIRVFIFIIIPLLIIAAFIEGSLIRFFG